MPPINYDISQKIEQLEGNNFNEKIKKLKVPEDTVVKYDHWCREMRKRLKKCNHMKDLMLNQSPFFNRPVKKPVGRPRKSFSEASTRTKSRRAKETISLHDSEEIALAAEMKMTMKGKRTAAHVMKIAKSSPSAAKKNERGRLC